MSRWRAMAAGLLVALASAGAQDDASGDLMAALRRARTTVARGAASVTVYFPPRPDPQRAAGQLPDVPFRPALLRQNFRVTSGAPATVAGRAARRFDLTPLNPQAARWTVWIDRAWNVPLAYEERGAGGALARRAALTRVRAAVPVRASLPPSAPPGLRHAVLGALPGFRFPPGFVPVAVRGPAGAAARHDVTLSDGVNVLSLVLSARHVAAAPGVAARRVGQRSVWLVGNLPPAALAAALAGVRAVNPGALGTFLAAGASNP